MDIENNNISEESIESQTEGMEAEAGTDEDGWPEEWTEAVEDDTGTEGEEAAAEPDADQQTDEPEPEQQDAVKPDETEPEQKAEEEDQFLELKHMDQIRKVNREEAKALAQKGLDYDRIRGERDSLKQESTKLREYESFLNELKGDFPDIEAMMTDTRARILADKDGISYADAVAKVRVMHPEKSQTQQNGSARENQTQVNPAVQRFLEQYPNVKAEEIPQSVWDKVKETGDLVGAYGAYERQKQADEIASLKKELSTLRQNQKNASRSPGSQGSSGKTSTKSLIQQMWDDDDY